MLGEFGVAKSGFLSEKGGFEEVEAVGGAVGEGFGAELSEGADERGGGSIGVVKRGGGGGVGGLDGRALSRFEGVERDGRLAATAFLAVLLVPGVGLEALEQDEEEAAELAAGGVVGGEPVFLDEAEEEFLGEVLDVFGGQASVQERRAERLPVAEADLIEGEGGAIRPGLRNGGGARFKAGVRCAYSRWFASAWRSGGSADGCTVHLGNPWDELVLCPSAPFAPVSLAGAPGVRDDGSIGMVRSRWSANGHRQGLVHQSLLNGFVAEVSAEMNFFSRLEIGALKDTGGAGIGGWRRQACPGHAEAAQSGGEALRSAVSGAASERGLRRSRQWLV